MGFLRSPTSEEDKEGETNQSFQELRKENNPPFEQSLTNPEDFSESFVDSLLDFDFLRDWMASDDGSENPVLFSSETLELDAMESIEMKCDGFSEKSKVEEGLKLDILGSVGEEKGEIGISENGTEMGGDVSCTKVMVEEGAAGDGCGKLGDLRCLIEEEMGKVSLVGVSNGSVSTASRVNAIESGDPNDAKIGGKEGGGDDIVGSVEVLNAVGIESGVVGSVGRNNGEIVSVNENKAKSGEQGSDQDESDSDSESDDKSESESGSESESESSSSSSSSSPSSSDDDEEEEEGEGDKKGKGEGGMRGGESKEAGEEGEIEMEEGEIVASDIDEMVAWSDDEDVGGGEVPVGPIKSKNEITVLPPVPPVNVTLQPHHQTLPVGAVLSIMSSQVVVEAVEKHNPLSEGSILWITESRSPLGIVDEIFGPVKNPYYIIRYNSESEVPTGIQSGTSVSYVPEFANHILNDKSLYQKGYDASGANDEEVLEEEEFSDDEKEAEYRKMMKMKKRGTNDEKVGNKKNDKKKFKNRPGNRKTDPAANQQVPLRQGNVPVDHSKHPVPPVVAPVNQGNGTSSSGLGHGSTGQPGMVPPFAQMGLNPGFNMPSGGRNGISFQQPQNMGIPGLPTNGMPWMQQVHPQPMYQMPLQSGLPFQQQIDAGSNLPPNLVLSGGQSGFGAAPGFLPLPAYLNQGMFNHSSFGMMGTPGQHAPLPMNLGEQAMPSNMPQMGYNQSFQPDNALSGNFNASPSFNRGRYSGGGRKAHRRGGGRFGGGRGRQQSG